MSTVQDTRNESVDLDLSSSGALEVIYNFAIGQEKLNKASFTISSVGLDAADTVVELQASNTKDKGFVTILDNAGVAVSITLPSGDDDNAVLLPEVGFSYIRGLITRNSSTVGVVTFTSR